MCQVLKKVFFIYQVDVLESQFSQLLHQINSTRDFESIRLAHDHFLSNLLAQSFILLKPVSRGDWLLSLICPCRLLDLTRYETVIHRMFKSIFTFLTLKIQC